MGVASGIGHFFQSIIEVIQGFFAAIFNIFALALHTVADAGKGVAHFIEGTLGFAIRKHRSISNMATLADTNLDNFFLLGTIAAAVLGYLYYQQRQNGSTRASKTLKTN